MINVPQGCVLSDRFRECIKLFNKLEKNLEYPECEGYADQKRVLQAVDKIFMQMFNQTC